MRILIIGVGSIGFRHLKNLLTLGYRSIAVVDPSSVNRSKATAEHVGIIAFSTLDAALQEFQPTVAFICTPTALHVAQARKMLTKGIDLFVEKPLSHSTKGLPELAALAREHKAIAMVACNYRFHGAYKKLKSLITQKKYGKSLFARAVVSYYLPEARKGVNYKKNYVAGRVGGGVLLDSGSHVIDYLRPLFGTAEKSILWRSDSHILKLEREEVGSIQIEYHSGAHATVMLDYVSRKPLHRLEIITTVGIFTLNFIEGVLSFESKDTYKELYRSKLDRNHMYIEEVKHFLQCVKKRTSPAQNFQDGLEVIRVVSGLKSKQ